MKTIAWVIIITCAVTGASFGQGKDTTSLKVGDPAPDFTLPYATKDSVASDELKLSSLFGKRNIILAFYPADWSGGCTKEMCTMRDNFTALSRLDAEVLPISGDYEYSHHEWAKYHNLPFKLVADHKHEVAKTYSSYNEMDGMNKRTVYVIDKNGRIVYMDLQYKARDMNSYDKLTAALKNLK
jgi:peroxiredoxin